MPMHVTIASLVTQRQYVQPLGRHHLLHSLRHAIDHVVERERHLTRKIARHVLAVLAGRDQGTAIENRYLFKNATVISSRSACCVNQKEEPV